MLPKIIVPLLVGASAFPAALAAAPPHAGSDLDTLHTRSDGLALQARADKPADKNVKNDPKKDNGYDSDFSDSDLNEKWTPPPSPKKDAVKKDAVKKDDKPKSPTSPKSPGMKAKGGIKKVPIFTKLYRQNNKDRAVCAKRQTKWCKDPNSKECKLIKDDCKKFDDIQKKYQDLNKQKKQVKTDLKKFCVTAATKDEGKCMSAHQKSKSLNHEAKQLYIKEKSTHNAEKKRECKAAMKKHCDGQDKSKCQHVKNECAVNSQSKQQRAHKCQADYKKFCDDKHEKECTAVKSKCGNLVNASKKLVGMPTPAGSPKKEKEEKQSGGGGPTSPGGGGGGKPKDGDKKDDKSNPVLSKSSGSNDKGKSDSKSTSKSDDHSTSSGTSKSSGGGGKSSSSSTDPLDDPELKIFGKRGSDLHVLTARDPGSGFGSALTARSPGGGYSNILTARSPGSGYGNILTARSPTSPLSARSPSPRGYGGGRGYGSMFKSAKQLGHTIHSVSNVAGHANDLAQNVGNTVVSVKSTSDQLRGKAPASPYGEQGYGQQY